MKKNLCIALTFIMMLSLVGCGPIKNLLSQNSYESTIPSDAVDVEDDVDDVDDVDVDEEDNEDVDVDDEKEDDDDNNGGSILDIRETIEETVLYDANDVKITAKELSFEDDWYAATMSVLVENNSDKDLTISTQSMYVNGYKINASLYCDVSAGKKSNETIYFYEDDFERCGIETIATIEISFDAYDDDYNDIFESDLIVLETSAADGFKYEYNDEGTVIFDEGDIKVVVQDLVTDEYGDVDLLIYLYNGTDDLIYLSTEDTSVNGFMIYSYGSCYLDADKHAVISVSFYASDLEENDIDEITDIELSFEVRDYNSYDTIAEIGPVTITF